MTKTPTKTKAAATPSISDQLQTIIDLKIGDTHNGSKVSKRSKVLGMWAIKQANPGELDSLTMYKVAQLLGEGFSPQMVRNYIVGSSGGTVRVLDDSEKKDLIQKLLAS